jgi:hypothetical protein
VLLWINGPFGGGKTHAADEIGRRLAGSIICDPEHLGYGLHSMMPARIRGDFQDVRAWRQGTSEVLELLLRKHQGDVIVPMTVIEPAYLDEILGPLRENGHQIRHYALLAERATILRRLRGRTDELTIAQTAERIAASAGLNLAPATSNVLRARAHRTWVTIKHVRLFRR